MCIGRVLGRLRDKTEAEGAYVPPLLWDPGKGLPFLVAQKDMWKLLEYRMVRQREGLR